MQSISKLKLILFFSIVVFFCNAFLEIGLRVIFAFKVGPSILLFGSSIERKTESVIYHSNKLGNYSKYFPNQIRTDSHAYTGKTFQVTINNQGFRGKDFVKAKKKGVIRIVTLGGSSTFGCRNMDHETYPYYLEEILNSKYKSLGSFEVINLGIPHLTAGQILALFLKEAIPLDPDIVTFYEGWNDSSVKAHKTAKKRNLIISFIRPVYDILQKYLAIVNLLDEIRLKMIREPKVSEQGVYKYMDGITKRFMDNLSQIHTECRNRGIIFIVANQQTKSDYIDRKKIKGITYQEEFELLSKKLSNEGYLTFSELYFFTHHMLMENLEAWVAVNNIHFVDIITALDQQRNVLVSKVHLNPRGNQIISQQFAKKNVEVLRPNLE